MPVHDWTKVEAGIFHDFHHTWITEIKRALNAGLLPPEFYALAEQVTGPFGPDVLTLRVPEGRGKLGGVAGDGNSGLHAGGLALADAPPRVRFRVEAESDRYAGKAKSVAIHHTSDHAIVAIVEIVSPGNKGSRRTMDAFVRKAEEALAAGIHLLVVEVFPPGPRDPQGIHPAIWQDRGGGFAPPPDLPLTCAAYRGAPLVEAFIEPFAVGGPLPEMPLFLTPDVYVSVPLEPTYQSASDAVPMIWRDVLEGRSRDAR
jgi:hypothetical protein